MDYSFKKILKGYRLFRKKYVQGETSVMQLLSRHGQQPRIMVVACCDSRVDPAVIFQCDPGDLFVVRNVANIVPPYEKGCEQYSTQHGTSAALEFGINFLKVKNLIILGHSQCGGIESLLKGKQFPSNDFITNWVSLIKAGAGTYHTADDYAKWALTESYRNSMTFPWIKERVLHNKLVIHLWFFDIKTGKIFMYSEKQNNYQPLDDIHSFK
jgi:carbonic anhydrase